MKINIFLVAFSAVVICVKLPFTKLPQLLSWIESKKTAQTKDEQSINEMIQIVNKVARFKYFLIRNNCLRKSLLFYYWLQKCGVSGIEIKFGVNMKDKKITGHSWITRDGKVFIDTAESTFGYTVTYSSGDTNYDK